MALVTRVVDALTGMYLGISTMKSLLPLTANIVTQMRPMDASRRFRLLVFVGLLSVAPALYAHEFWLAPHRYAVEEGGQVDASIRVGQMFNGAELPYLTTGFSEFTRRTSQGTTGVAGFEGDLPAASYAASTPGLHVLTYHSRANRITYDSWETFLEYLAYEGLEAVADQHRTRQLPAQGFDESYIRYAKTLVQVGPYQAEDTDVAQGAPFEIVAEDSPYEPGLEVLQVRLLRHNEPVGNRQIAIIRYDGTVSRSLTHTDAVGRATIDIGDGGTYLLNATDLQPADMADDPAGNKAVWQSYWASLTFGLPIALPAHPLDPLASIEIVRATQIIGQSGYADKDTRVALVTVEEPLKTKVLAWQPGDPFSRRAAAVVRNGGDVFEAVVDLEAGELISWEQVPGVQPALSSDEWARASEITMTDPGWLAAMRLRGYEDVSKIFCEGLSVGFFDVAANAEKRLVKMPCYDIVDAQSNIYGRPIEGLISVVDLTNARVDQILDSGVVPVSRQSHEFAAAGDAPADRASDDNARAEPAAARNYIVDERVVSWKDWSFHLGFDQRFGPVVSLVRHADKEQQRMVLYQGHVSEVFVPYMDASEAWYFRTPMDVGEFGLGMLASPLAAGIDCPDDATFIDADVAHPTGSVYHRPRVLCVFERDAKAPLWRHWEALNGAYAGRRASELVVRAIPAIGNYDYIVDWVFTEKGEIEVNIGATGIDAVKGVDFANVRNAAQQTDDNGMLVAPNLVAVHHDHYFSIRLDLDVDGPVNNFVRQRLQTMDSVGEQQRSLWRLVNVPMNVEGAVSARQGPELWRVESTTASTGLGHQPSFQLTGGGVTSMLAGRDWPHKRGAFAGESLWVTSHKPKELFASGQHPNQSGRKDGVEAYANGERIDTADIVVWYTIGFNHLTRPEDWPVLPTIWHGMKLRPYGFFEKNPSAGKDH